MATLLYSRSCERIGAAMNYNSDEKNRLLLQQIEGLFRGDPQAIAHFTSVPPEDYTFSEADVAWLHSCGVKG